MTPYEACCGRRERTGTPETTEWTAADVVAFFVVAAAVGLGMFGLVYLLA